MESWMFGAASAGLGAVFVAAGWLFFRQGRRLRTDGQRVTGTVVRINWHQSGDSGSSLSGYPVMRFRTVDGRDMVVESDVGTRPCPLREGQQVTVVYDRTNPELARPEQLLSAGSWLATALAVLGVLALVVGAVALVAAG